MHGSERLKLEHTSFLTNVEELSAPAVACDGQHSHKPWGLDEGQFATAQEAATNTIVRSYVGMYQAES